MVEELDFDSLETIEVAVRYKGQSFILREADGEAATKYKNKMIACGRGITEKGVPSEIRGFADLEPYLISLCLFRPTDNNPRGEGVPEQVIRTWPHRMIKQLFKKAVEISELDEKDEDLDKDALKNEQQPTETGSS